MKLEAAAVLSFVLCAGTMGLVADLTAGEILEQLVHAQQTAPIQNVVFMVRRSPDWMGTDSDLPSLL